MTALAEKLKAAGVDTVGARLTDVCIEGLRLYPDSLIKAWAHVGMSFGYDFLRDRAKDMGLPDVPERSFRPIQPRIVTSEQLERRRQLKEVVRSKFKNSAGVAWSDVSWHELPALARDGNEAVALLTAGPAGVPNDGRTVGQVLGIRRTDQIIKAARAAVSSTERGAP